MNTMVDHPTTNLSKNEFSPHYPSQSEFVRKSLGKLVQCPFETLQSSIKANLNIGSWLILILKRLPLSKLILSPKKGVKAMLPAP